MFADKTCVHIRRETLTVQFYFSTFEFCSFQCCVNGERTNCMHPNRGNLTVGLKTETVGFVGLIFQRPQIFFHNFVSFHPILMFHTILESGDKTNDIGDEFKTIRSSQIIT